MVSVSDIFARVMNSPNANEAGGGQSDDGSEPGNCGLLTFIQQFAEPSAAPLAAPARPGDLPAQNGEPVNQPQWLGQPHTAAHDGLSGLEPDMLLAAVDENPYLQAIFEAAFSGRNLPIDGEILPDEAAIVATLLSQHSLTPAPGMPAGAAATEGDILSASASAILSHTTPSPVANGLSLGTSLPFATDVARDAPSASATGSPVPGMDVSVPGAEPGVEAEPTFLSSDTVTPAVGSGATVPNSAATLAPDRNALPEPAQAEATNQPGISWRIRLGGEGAPEAQQAQQGTENPHGKEELIRDLRPMLTAATASLDPVATPNTMTAPLPSATSATVTTAPDLALPLSAAMSTSVPSTNMASLNTVVPAVAQPSTAGDEGRQMSLLLSGEGRDRALAQERWADGVGRQLLVMQRDGLSTARMRLDPPSLGTLAIQIQMTEQGTSVSFVAQHALVRDALEHHTTRLQELFQEQELNLLDVTVSDQEAHDQDPKSHVSDVEEPELTDSEQDVNIVAARSEHLIDERV